MKPFFSVIIPTLNEEKFLPNLLSCLREQEFSSFEVVIVDAASKDKTIEVARKCGKELEKKKVELKILSSKKRNVSHQRNLGAKKARGRYLVFFDADVEIGRDFLDKVYKHIKKEESLLLTTWIKPDSEEIIDELLVLLTNYGIELARYTRKPFVPGFNIIVERNTFWAIGGFEEKVKMAEDHYFTQRARKKGINMRFLKEPSLKVSLRRFRSEGRIEVLRKYTKSLTHILLKGPITKDLFDYPMGGDYHLNHKKKSLKDRLKNMLIWKKSR